MIDTKTIKAKILDLAMCGKLVSQDPNDEPVEELLARIRDERIKLEKDRKIPKVEETEIYWSDDDNCYYEKNKKIEDINILPKNWKYIRLGFYTQKISKEFAIMLCMIPKTNRQKTICLTCYGKRLCPFLKKLRR